MGPNDTGSTIDVVIATKSIVCQLKPCQICHTHGKACMTQLGRKMPAIAKNRPVRLGLKMLRYTLSRSLSGLAMA